jgi:glycosyltransferase involved in cell wall biosynthesis
LPVIQHVITSLNAGGAQAMLVKLIEAGAGQNARSRPTVLTLMRPGVMTGALRAVDCPIYTLKMRQGIPGPLALLRLLRISNMVSPDLIQGWMYHGNVAASLSGRSQSPAIPVIWNVRHSLADAMVEKSTTRALLSFSTRISRSTAAIVYNSRASAREHEAAGFAADRTVHIPNGFDCDLYRPDPARRSALRGLFGIRNDAVVVAMIARLHPMKDHAMLIEAVARARAAGHDIHLLMVGTGIDTLPPPLADAVAALPQDRVTLIAERHDVANWLPGVDIVALSSAWGEAFPNILGEAMACGVPCIATDVGDSAWIIGETGITVPPRDASAMADAIGALAAAGAEERRRRGDAARARIANDFRIEQITRDYHRLYASIAERAPPTPSADRARGAPKTAGAPIR